MSRIIEITDFMAPELDVYARMTEVQLLNREFPEKGVFIAEYLTSWDVGIGIGMVVGGYIAEISTFKMAYLCGAILTVVSFFYFRIKVSPHFHRNKLR